MMSARKNLNHCNRKGAAVKTKLFNNENNKT